MIDLHKLDRLLDFTIVVVCISGVLCSFALLAEVGRTSDTVEWSKRATATTPVVVAAPPEETAGEDPEEDALIEQTLLAQGYYRDDVPLSYELQEALHTACEEFGVRYELALAVIERETGFQDLTGDGGESVGYFQIQPRWWGDLMEQIEASDLADPVQNFRTGCAILAQLIGQYGCERDALTAYNSGHAGESEYASAVLKAAERWDVPGEGGGEYL